MTGKGTQLIGRIARVDVAGNVDPLAALMTDVLKLTSKSLATIGRANSHTRVRTTELMLDPLHRRDVRAELDRRGIEYRGTPGGARLELPGLAGEGAKVFLRESSSGSYSWADAVGPSAVAEVVIGAVDLAAAQGRWRRLLDPLRPVEQGLWCFADGPSLRVVSAARDAVLGLKLRVASLAQARSAIERAGMMGAITAAGIEVEASESLGLDVLLVD